MYCTGRLVAAVSCLQIAISQSCLHIVVVAGTTQPLTMSTEYQFTLRLFSCNTGRIVVSLMPESSLRDLRGEAHFACTLTLFKCTLPQSSPPGPTMQIIWCPQSVTLTNCCWHNLKDAYLVLLSSAGPTKPHVSGAFHAMMLVKVVLLPAADPQDPCCRGTEQEGFHASGGAGLHSPLHGLCLWPHRVAQPCAGEHAPGW